MSDEPKPNPEMTATALKAAMMRGTRLCSEHSVMPAGQHGETLFWNICLARLPLSLERYKQSAYKESHLWGGYQEWEQSIGHFWIKVTQDEEAEKFLRPLAVGKPNPLVHHIPKEMVFIRLDIARFTQFPEELQPRVIADVHELIFDQLTQILGPDCLTTKSKAQWRQRVDGPCASVIPVPQQGTRGASQRRDRGARSGASRGRAARR